MVLPFPCIRPAAHETDEPESRILPGDGTPNSCLGFTSALVAICVHTTALICGVTAISTSQWARYCANADLLLVPFLLRVLRCSFAPAQGGNWFTHPCPLRIMAY